MSMALKWLVIIIVMFGWGLMCGLIYEALLSEDKPVHETIDQGVVSGNSHIPLNITPTPIPTPVRTIEPKLPDIQLYKSVMGIEFHTDMDCIRLKGQGTLVPINLKYCQEYDLLPCPICGDLDKTPKRDAAQYIYYIVDNSNIYHVEDCPLAKGKQLSLLEIRGYGYKPCEACCPAE
jgi:hypothetical protein